MDENHRFAVGITVDLGRPLVEPLVEALVVPLVPFAVVEEDSNWSVEEDIANNHHTRAADS